ncbi:hypothetical protein [Streptomyces sirii]|uniref:hypothetical protein n=1 Tax=Streptomyces sirii TaxID=3127701 RepID=UPI003D36034C
MVWEDAADVSLAFDHIYLNTPSISCFPTETHELAARDGRLVEMAPVGSHLDFCTTERPNADRFDDMHTIVARRREFVAPCDEKLPNLPTSTSISSLNGCCPLRS